MSDKTYDAVIIGGGHHGTTIAPYLAKAGLNKIGIIYVNDDYGISGKQVFAKFFRSMLDDRINLAPSQYEAGFMSAAHSQADLDQTIEAAAKAFKNL